MAHSDLLAFQWYERSGFIGIKSSGTEWNICHTAAGAYRDASRTRSIGSVTVGSSTILGRVIRRLSELVSLFGFAVTVMSTCSPEYLPSGISHWCHWRSEEHTSELQSQSNIVCRL